MKSKFLLLSIPFFIFLETSIAQTGLVGCYPLNNNANDFSGNSYNGTLLNVTPVPDRFGNPNSAYNFSGNNSYIDIPDTGFFLNEYTYSLWCKPSNTPFLNNGFTALSIGGMIADQAIQMGNNASMGPIFGGFGYDSNQGTHGCSGYAEPLMLNEWYHLVLTRSDTMINFYIDDSLICSIYYPSVTAGYMGSNLTATIGKRSGTVPQYFEGDIDEVKIFNRVLSSTEIKSLDTICAFIGIDDFSFDKSINIYPNPTNGSFSIASSDLLKDVEVRIFNMIGEKIYSEIVNGFSKQLTLNVPEGVYPVMVIDGRRSYCKKLIVTK